MHEQLCGKAAKRHHRRTTGRKAWEIATLAQLGNAQFNGSGARLPIAVTVGVPLGEPHRALSPKSAPVAPPTSSSPINRSAAKPIISSNKSASALFSTSERTFIMSLVIGDLSITLVLNNPTLKWKTLRTA